MQKFVISFVRNYSKTANKCCGTKECQAKKIDVPSFIFKNYTSYTGGSEFLAQPTEKTQRIWNYCESLLKEELKKGVLDVDTKTISTITSHKPGYINKDDDVVVGLQTDKPLKRMIKPFGGISMVKGACEAYGYKLDENVNEIFTKYRKTHNQGVFDIYTDEMKLARSNGIITGLPDGYGRGRIIGDYRRVALFGIDALIEAKKNDKKEISLKDNGAMDEHKMQLVGELADQIKALEDLKVMAKSYGFDISKPATNAKEAVQWTYFAYLAAIKEQDGAAMSFGRIDSFFDVYFEKDLKEGKITEEEAQEIIDQFVIKLRFVRHLRTPEYNNLFSGDPTWVTLVLGGLDKDGKPLVTKTSYRLLQTLNNLGGAPEPNITILWDEKLPKEFKDFCAQVSIKTSAIQYESDVLMRPCYGEDYAIACCVSAMGVGKAMQFFGARCNLAKLLLYTLNEGKDEVSGQTVAKCIPKIKENADGSLDFDTVWNAFDKSMNWLTSLYVNTMNIIHFSHDRYCYEALQLALHDTEIIRYMAFGIAGLSVVADSFSAMKYGKVYPIRDPKTGLTKEFKIEGNDWPKYGNDDDRVDQMAKQLAKTFTEKLRKNKTYRDSVHTLSVLTITSNVVYGNMTGDTPDGRKLGDAFSPGANPMHNRDIKGAIASLNSVAKIDYEDCKDGISNTFSIVPQTLGKSENEQITNLVSLLDGYFENKGFHLNVNVLNKEKLMDAMNHPEKYSNLTIRVSGYAVNFLRLTKKQQMEVISRTFHQNM